MQHTRTRYTQPRWWDDTHDSVWSRARDAMRRDWEQTKADVSSKGTELNQDAADTVKQAAGKQPIPPRGVPNRDQESWDEIEPAVRYGFGARHYYSGHHEWNDELEGKLRSDWESANEGSTWESVKGHVRRGWDSVKRALH